STQAETSRWGTSPMLAGTRRPERSEGPLPQYGAPSCSRDPSPAAQDDLVLSGLGLALRDAALGLRLALRLGPRLALRFGLPFGRLARVGDVPARAFEDDPDRLQHLA